ncbi:MAG: SIS domain-containing protein [Chitinophagales bacterium]
MNIQEFTAAYNNEFAGLPDRFEVTAENNHVSYAEGIERAVALVQKCQQEQKKIMLIGNGGSAGITSHMAIDFWKNGKVKATAFNDASLLTCLSNDYSYDEVFVKPIEMFGEPGDLLFAISSSGNSANIVNAAKAASAKGIHVVTFSGFQADNKLRAAGVINFFVPAFSYGFVEVLHNYIIHCILDAKLYCHDKVNIFHKNQPL